MTTKPTPDELMQLWDSDDPNDPMIIDKSELADALRNALQQRDEARWERDALSETQSTLMMVCNASNEQLKDAKSKLDTSEQDRALLEDKLQLAVKVLESISIYRPPFHDHSEMPEAEFMVNMARQAIARIQSTDAHPKGGTACGDLAGHVERGDGND